MRRSNPHVNTAYMARKMSVRPFRRHTTGVSQTAIQRQLDCPSIPGPSLPSDLSVFRPRKVVDQTFQRTPGSRQERRIRLQNCLRCDMKTEILRLELDDWVISMARLAYFYGTDADNNSDLFISDGLVADTVPVGGIADSGVSGTYEFGLRPDFIAPFGDEVLFAGSDNANPSDYSLWVSNGTAAGTYEVGGSNNAGVSGGLATGLEPSGFVTFGNKALFNARSSSDTEGLWVTDGTTSGTFELGGLNNAGVVDKPKNGTLSFTTFASLGDEALFTGQDGNGYSGLWLTNGTSAGTIEVGGLGGKGIGGFSTADDLTAVINGEAIFGGYDTSRNDGLWITDGAAAGTTEIGGLGNAGVAGNRGNLGSINSWVVVDGQMIFASGAHLWVTNGTAAGTVEIGGSDDQAVGAYATGLNPGALAAFNLGAVFTGYAKDGSLGLWFTNGTTAGTYEIGGIDNSGVAGAPLSGLDLVSGFDVSASLGNKLVFDSMDAAGEFGLWVTDGTPAGTFELGGLADQGVAGADTSGLQAIDLASSGSEVFFVGEGVNDNQTLWVTNGTTAGTHPVTTNDVSSLTVAGSAVGPQSAPNDYMGNGVSDIVWQNSSNGAAYEWLMNNGELVNNVYLGALSGWSDVGSGNFYGDGTDGMLWQNQSSGQVYEWSFADGAHVGNVNLGNLSGWKAAGVGAFYGAGTSGVVWQNETTGIAYEWSISNGQHGGNDVYLGSLAGWSEIGTGDFNGDGTADMLWQNATTGVVYEWQMANGQRSASVYLGNPSGYTMIGAGDFNGDGTSDLLWKSNTTGEVWEWQMNSAGQNGQSIDLGNLTGYNVASIGDFNGSGVAGIVWQGASAGDTWLWNMSNGQHAGSTYLGDLSSWIGH
jgi:FG-GAP-like repeat